MKIYVVIPTCKFAEVSKQEMEIANNTPESCIIMPTCMPLSAAANRNLAHRMAEGADIVVSVDDDITGFYPGWLKDIIDPLLKEENIRFASARFLRPDGKTLAPMMTTKFDISQQYEEVPRCPTGAYAYRWKEFNELINYHNDTSLPFDERFIGSGCEDDAICHDLKKRFPDTRIIINNNCKLIHLNEMKNQRENLKRNREIFIESGRKQ